ncbi:uncharacterized protein Z520_04878 [Fonsecaea multimorphosa CBS 102226]|uniref:histone acetyltransferase n=1 Tax=Fonsecaea multimorphosa CBS 102226 TaxID=1442371 RepID=A0A0D2K0G6_9EURO|nr:uncharacterized protein Z520_04878 [Fonsecaea multimorphosa CBS 102226]KIX99302.1 hypothetical protein Z520_04878 [Fonsecaea multimorphosa CBS 102226]OAL25828.1 hypothetical protein AYO22_04622 [Fonsecaea multimorphosa]
MSGKPSLPSRLAAVLPVGLDLRVYHLSTPPTPGPALFAPLNGHDEEATLCESHFLAVSSPEHEGRREVLVYAIEVLVFTTQSLVTLFVSKADSSGFSSRLNQHKGSPSAVAAITSTFVEFLLEPRLSSSRVVVSLFARSQNQYLFPGSSENAGKHILDDRQLIKWWCRVLDRVLRLPKDDLVATAHLLVPGCDKGETRAFFPPSSREDSSSDPKWINSYPVNLLVTDPSIPPRNVIPRLPDDPKARFLDDLDGDFVDEKGCWRSVKTLDQFWEMMSYRQECSAGRLVGFLWLVFSRGQTQHAALGELERRGQTENLTRPPTHSSLVTPVNSQQHDTGVTESSAPTASVLKLIAEPNSPPSSSPIHPEPESKPSEQTQNADRGAPVPGQGERSPLPTIEQMQGELVISTTQYQALMDHLLQTDFAGEAIAADATKSWVDKAMELSMAASFGHPVQGHATPVLALSTAPDTVSAKVNMLTGVRKKRKADTMDNGTTVAATTTEVTQEAAVTTANSLSASLVRKKPKS